MTDLNYENNGIKSHRIDIKSVIEISTVCGLLLLAFEILFNSNILTDFQTLFSDAIQPAIHHVIHYCPVEISMPSIPMGPNWNGSGGDNVQLIEASELLHKINRQ